MRLNIGKNVISAGMAALLLLVLLPAWPVMADSGETSTGAEVQVLPEETISYGARVTSEFGVLWPGLALGKPDRFGAICGDKSWAEIKLKTAVINCQTVSIWAGGIGWPKPRFTVYISTDGKKWKLTGNIKPNSLSPAVLSLSSDFGTVGYIKVVFSGSRLSWGLLDAVGAKGGDVGR